MFEFKKKLFKNYDSSIPREKKYYGQKKNSNGIIIVWFKFNRNYIRLIKLNTFIPKVDIICVHQVFLRNSKYTEKKKNSNKNYSHYVIIHSQVVSAYFDKQ